MRAQLRPRRRRHASLQNEGGWLFGRALQQRAETQEQAEQRLAVSSGLASRLISGKRKPGRELALRLRAIYGIPLEAWDRPTPARTGTDG